MDEDKYDQRSVHYAKELYAKALGESMKRTQDDLCNSIKVVQLHLDASAYANKRIAMHKEAIKKQKQTPLDDKVHNGTWIAHYEGYVAGYEAKEKNNG
jgi:hypothetical protein